MKITLNGANMTSRADAHREIALALSFPAHYGNNIDALWDMISHLEADVTLVNATDMIAFLGDYGEKLIATFRDAADLNRGFKFHQE